MAFDSDIYLQATDPDKLEDGWIELDDWEFHSETSTCKTVTQGKQTQVIPNRYINIDEDGHITILEWIALERGMI